MNTAKSRFIRDLKNYELSKQQIKTLRGQAIAGDLEGARKGLERLIGGQSENYMRSGN